MDPSAESAYSWSPYNYTFDNPVMFNDPNGEFPWPPIGLIVRIGSALSKANLDFKNYKSYLSDTHKSGKYISKSVGRATGEGQLVAKTITDATYLSNPIYENTDVRWSAGITVGKIKEEIDVEMYMEYGTDKIIKAGAKATDLVECEVAVSLEEKDVNVNLEVMDISIGESIDEDKIEIQTPTAPVYTKILFDPIEFMKDWFDYTSVRQQIKDSYNLHE